LHATVNWNGSHWILKDNSSNGTYINQQAVTPGILTVIKTGDTLQFGSLDSPPWVMTNDDPPKCMLIPIDAQAATQEVTDVLVLPNETTPEITIYQSSSGHWQAETHNDCCQLESGMKLDTSVGSWVFIAPESTELTQQAHSESESVNAATIFQVSQDEEHVKMSALMASTLIDFGERTHHYLLLFLARLRLKDIQMGVAEPEQGWIDKTSLSQQTGLDENYINLQIYRFRQQLYQAPNVALQLLNLVERRRGKVRFGQQNITIQGGQA
jgi:hypothetical protein